MALARGGWAVLLTEGTLQEQLREREGRQAVAAGVKREKGYSINNKQGLPLFHPIQYPPSPKRREVMPLPMPEEEEKFRCPHGERNQALMLCSLDCDLSGAHSDRKAKADGRFIITSWWCLHKCRWLPEHRDEIRFVAKKSD